MEKTLYIVDKDFLLAMKSDMNTIKQSLENLKLIKPPERYTANEFMEITKMSRWKFDVLVSQRLINYKKLGKKFYIEPGEVQRYFAGEMEIKNKEA